MLTTQENKHVLLYDALQTNDIRTTGSTRRVLGFNINKYKKMGWEKKPFFLNITKKRKKEEVEQEEEGKI